MLNKMTWKKECLLIVVAVVCLVIFYYRQELDSKTLTDNLPILGGLAFGLNTLVQIAK